MKNYIKDNLVALTIILAGTLISISILWLDIMVKIFTIIGSLSLVVAIFTYFYQKKQDKTLAALDQITFMREKIIFEWLKVSNFILTKNPKYMFSSIEFKLDKYTIDDIKVERPRNFHDQLSIFFDNSKPDLNVWVDNSILNQQIFLLNMLEEFSLRVNHFEIQQHPALQSIYVTFIEVVEKNAAAIAFTRDIKTNNPVYSTLLSLYINWKDKVKKSNFINNLEKHGFITDKQKQEIFKEQRRNARDSEK